MKRIFVLMIAVLMLGTVACGGVSEKGQEDDTVENTETVTGELVDIRFDRFSSGRSYTLLHIVTDDNTDHYFGLYGWEELLGQSQSLKVTYDKDEGSLRDTVETKHNPDGSIEFVEISWIHVELTDITIFPKPTPPKTITISK